MRMRRRGRARPGSSPDRTGRSGRAGTGKAGVGSDVARPPVSANGARAVLREPVERRPASGSGGPRGSASRTPSTCRRRSHLCRRARLRVRPAPPWPRSPRRRSRRRSRAGRILDSRAARSPHRAASLPQRIRPGLAAVFVDELEPSEGNTRRNLETSGSDLPRVRFGQDLPTVPVAGRAGADR